MKTLFVKSIPYDHHLVTLALESGVDGVVVDEERVGDVEALGRTTVLTTKAFTRVEIAQKADEEFAAEALGRGERVLLARGVEIIPVENLLAASGPGSLGVEVGSYDEAVLMAGVLERGVDELVVLPEAAGELKRIVEAVKLAGERADLVPAVVTAIKPAGLGHRVCVDTLSMLATGQGMLVGNAGSFSFLVHAETETNPYVASRPFRVNAGAVHAYVALPGDRTSYLGELAAGDEVLVVDAEGGTRVVTVGRCKVEIRPMLLVMAKVGETEGGVFLQNAETIRLVRPGGEPVSVVSLREGDEILVKTDAAGRHFGMRVEETIAEG